jgi:protein SCO1/2
MNHHAKPYLNLRKRLAAFACIAALALSACTSEPAAVDPGEPPLLGADIGGEFELVNSSGETVRWSDFDGTYRTVYFGYAFCPDFCPNDMAQLTRGFNLLKERAPDKAAQVIPIFITIDPERDTPEVVGEFTSAFSDDLIGLSGSPEQIRTAADVFRIPYSRGREFGDGQYLMNHPTYTMLFNRNGEPVAFIPTDEGPEAVAAELKKWVN